MMGELQCEPENFTGRIIFMSMFNDIVGDAKGNEELCERNSSGHWSFLELGSKRSGTELTMANQMYFGIERPRKCCRNSKIRVAQYSVVPVPWREDN